MPNVETPSRITVVDDDPLDREALMDELRDLNFEPSAVSGPYGQDIDRLVQDVQAQGGGFVICDHRLQPSGFASFNGALVVARLLTLRVPAMLLTMYQSTNRLELRECRHAVPVIVGRANFEPEAVAQYAEVCRREIEDDPVDERKPHRVLIRVDEVRDGQIGTEIDAVVPSWRPEHAITIPGSCVAPEILQKISAGSQLLGYVNIDAPDEDDLFFKDVDELVSAGQERPH